MDFLAAVDEDIMACKVELLQVQSILQSNAKRTTKNKTAATRIYEKLYLIQLALRRIKDHGYLERTINNELHAAHLLHKRMKQYAALLTIYSSQDTVLKDSAYQQFTTAVLTILHAIDVFLFDINGDESLKAAVDNATNLWKAYIETGDKSTDVLNTTLISIGDLMRKLPKDKCGRFYPHLRAIGKALAKGESTQYITDLSYPPGWGKRGPDIYDQLLNEPI